MENLFLKIKGELLQQGRSNYVACVIASSICFKIHELRKHNGVTDNDIEKLVKEYLKNEKSV